MIYKLLTFLYRLYIDIFIDFRLHENFLSAHFIKSSPYLCGTAYRNVSRWQTLLVLTKCPTKRPCKRYPQVCEMHLHTHPAKTGKAWNKVFFILSLEYMLFSFSDFCPSFPSDAAQHLFTHVPYVCWTDARTICNFQSVCFYRKPQFGVHTAITVSARTRLNSVSCHKT